MSTRLDRLNSRRVDDYVANAKLQNEVYRRISNTDSVRYVIGSMQPIDPEYTKNTYEQGERVCKQLQKRLATSCDYEYQGSVTNDTHIRARSDIDVLVITQDFETLERPQAPSNPYQGDPIQDLIDLRQDAVTCLSDAFPEANIDSSGSKSIAIDGGSLRRKIDVVPANWYNTNLYAEHKNKVFRGVQILDAEAKARLKNTPFFHNALINMADSKCNGGLRKAARLMKSLKYDSDNVDLSSYDIVSIAYNIPQDKLNVPFGGDLQILDVCFEYCFRLYQDESLRSSIEVPDGHRKVFTEGHATLKGLVELTLELKQLLDDVLKENERSFTKLAEARVEY